MNKVININFQGRILPIEEVAYEMLKQYIESLRTYFQNEEGRDEIINDIECRIAELCEDRLKKGDVCIDQTAINLIIASIGRPADFEAQDGFEANTTAAENNTNSDNAHTEPNDWSSTHQKRLYRDEKNKVLGGVCSGIANYFNIDPLVVRILWIFLIGINILGYLILWIAVPSSSVKEVGGPKKRLFRDVDNKIIGGVCAGLSKYFGLQVWIIRVLFLIPFIRFVINFRHVHLFQFWEFPDFPNFLDLTFSPGAIFVYIVLWLVLPEAKTSADKLEMIGEKVDLNSIKNTIQNDMEGFSKRAQTWGNEFYKKSGTTNTNNTNASESNEASIAPESRSGCLHFIGRAITISVKVFVYFVLGIILISLLAALFGIGVVTTGLLPLKKFILEEGLQTAAFIGTIILFIWVPIIGIVSAIIRKIAGFKKSNIWVRSSFIALWVLGWICFFYFISSIGNSFSKHNQPAETAITLAKPGVEFLEVTATPRMKYYEEKWFHIEPFNFYDEDTVYVRNLKIRIVQSKTDSFEVKYVTMSNGKTVVEANTLAKKINFNITQQDSLVYLDRGIAITKQDKFRNQHVIMTIAVPIGKRIKITNKGWSQTNVNVKVNHRGIQAETIDNIGRDNWVDEWDENWDNESYSFERGVEYKMTTTGLEKIKRDDDAIQQDNDDSPSEMESRLEELKREREQLENNLNKSREEKQKELDRIDRALKNKANEKATDKISTEVSKKSAMSQIPDAVSKLGDLHWVLERFTY